MSIKAEKNSLSAVLMKMDKDKIKIKINEIWAVNQKVYPLGGLGISWSGNIGFGEYILRCGEDGMLHADTEHMDIQEDMSFTRLIFEELQKKIIIDE